MKGKLSFLVFSPVFCLAVWFSALAQESPPPSLKGVEVPPVVERISELDLVPHFVVDELAAIELGKTLFWDQQVGSDGQACASCHFNAGMDNRIKNQLSPAFIGGNAIFDGTASGGAGGPNYTFVADDFPFHQETPEFLQDFDTDDVSSSQGVFPTDFTDIEIPPPASTGVPEARDDCTPIGPPDPVGFHVGGINVRRVEPRNTPTVVNAVLNFRNFWDGRANNVFNGNDPFGRRNQDARVLEKQSDGTVAKIIVEFENSSLASQSVGPPLSDFEMSCAGRTFPKIGKKMLSLPPLALQVVHEDDSVLGSLSNDDGSLTIPGISATYADMIEVVFDPRFWDSDKLFDVDKNEIGSGAPMNTSEFTMKEANFALFWGLAIQLYQSTLIADDSPFDNGNLNQQELDGLDVFLDQGKCINCHGTAMFTKASTLHLIAENQEEGLVERMLMGQDHKAYQLTGSGNINGGTKYTVTAHMIRFGPFQNGVDTDPSLGTWKINEGKGKNALQCDYAVQSVTANPDGTLSTVDIQFGLIPEGGSPAGCGASAELIVFPDSDEIKFSRDGGLVVASAVNGNYQLHSRIALYDNGFYNIGTRPTEEDIGVGGEDPFDNPLSFTRQYLDLLRGLNVPDPFQIDECKFEIRFDPDIDIAFFPGGFDSIACDDGSTAFKPTDNAANDQAIRTQRVAVDGAFKVATIRNTELSGPFFHNGGQKSLEEVVQFYNRGADFAQVNQDNLDPDIQPLGLSDDQQEDLVAFMNSLTDERVRCEQEPFDHPQIFVPNGHPGDETMVTEEGMTGHATDAPLEIPAVGAGGLPEEGLACLVSFDEVL